MDLFTAANVADATHALGRHDWPPPARFPLNRDGLHVRHQVWPDLVRSSRPLIVAGYSSIEQLIDLTGDWAEHHIEHHAGHRTDPTATSSDADRPRLRVLLGTEPFTSDRVRFGDPRAVFTAEVTRYWTEERGISVVRSARVLRAIQLVDAGRIEVRFLHGRSPLHAKVHVGDHAATIGSSNFTDGGLRARIEANARFDHDTDPERFDETRRIAENLWATGQDWTAAFRDLLESLLQPVGWREALARACTELLEGRWALAYVGDTATSHGMRLWPSQVVGIAQALWVVDRVGSVLVADATGSGKTRMGAHLVRAIRDRLWSTGRVRTDRITLVCPPAVQESWDRHALECGVQLTTVSHGKLSRADEQDLLMSAAQILAVDEAHHYLNPTSSRTRQVRGTNADHVALFTATPINRGPTDLLQLVALLGADNFRDETLEVLASLQRRRSRHDGTTALEDHEVEALRAEIQQFTVRRTKTMLNELVETEPDAYRHPVTGRVCRYPEHHSTTYPTGETESDERIATEIRSIVDELVGVDLLEQRLAVPAALRSSTSDERWLEFRRRAVAGLAAHHVLSAMRSSRAAAIEHLAGTAVAVSDVGVDLGGWKQQVTGDVIGKLRRRADQGPPTVELTCPTPDWLTDPGAWAEVCHAEADRHERILALVRELSDARERAKAAVIDELASRHRLVLAFDRHPITLAVIDRHLDGDRHDVAIATGSAGRQRVAGAFAPDSSHRGIALCSDAMNEGLNLQGASAVVHLDLPTTLRVAEQRIGRVDRMDSPHDRIEVRWPDDGPAFATRANEHLARRATDSEELLGSNLPIPDELRPVSVHEELRRADEFEVADWDGLRDALDPVRGLVSGRRALIDEATYRELRDHPGRVVARVSTVRARRPWVFLTVAGSDRGAPRWMLLEDGRDEPLVELEELTTRLRTLLTDDPADVALDDDAMAVLDRLTRRAARSEVRLLPRRHQRALDQMDRVCRRLAQRDGAASRFAERERWLTLADLTHVPTDDQVVGADLHQVAERWLRLVAPVLEDHRRSSRKPFVLLRDIESRLFEDPFHLEVVEAALEGVDRVAPLTERVTACIVGVPDRPGRDPGAVTDPAGHGPHP